MPIAAITQPLKLEQPIVNNTLKPHLTVIRDAFYGKTAHRKQCTPLSFVNEIEIS